MVSAHTPGWLQAFTQYAEPELRDAAGNTVAVVTRYGHANARRLAACWNVCDGISTDDLGACPDGAFSNLAINADQLVTHRDTLLAACRQAEPVLADLERLLQARAPGFEGLAALQAVRQAIAKAAA